VSKNVAVFVDVANIFYAAKAAGVDIDYVTLLKSATAGRDFVRAYAYTGLDPENENQRQFHAFLARSGYKVISKDIRKYGDGRIKANLDIELVVDMMRMAEKLDIAVVVSGDGDFAPAIHAVQQQGVRVEVISFRGNTSSDLIDAADVFIDIASVARVEKGARSGRRVATEGDLSMTAVPEKESGVTPRRRRSSEERTERPERPERPSRRRSAAAASTDGDADRGGGQGLVALPGERLSRGAGDAPVPTVYASDADAGDDEGVEMPLGATDGEQLSEDGRRRRRRRGGRGRGRSGRPEGGVAADIVAGGEPEATDYADEIPTLPQHSGFGSVWDSQIGVGTEGGRARASAPRPDVPIDEELDGEPEVPEYLLAERRNQDRRRGGRGRGTNYRSAIDRERFGAGSRPGFTRSPGPGRGGRGGRPASTGRASVHAMDPIEQTPGGDPWSEVPPEVQELLRAEMARRQPSGRTPGRSTSSAAEAAPVAETAPAAEAAPVAEEAKPKRTTRRRSTSSTAEAGDA